MSDKNNLAYITHRINQPRQNRIYNTLKMRYKVYFPNSIFNDNKAIEASAKDILRLLYLYINSERLNKVGIIDNFMSLFYPRFNKKKYIYEYGSVLPIQLEYLGNSLLSNYGYKREKKIVRNSSGIICINDPLKKRCESMNGDNIFLLPNYPSKNFKITVSREEWREKNDIVDEKKVCLFTGGSRLKEIYGLDLLLDSWSLINSTEFDTMLIMMCHVNDQLNYEIEKRRLKNVKLIPFSPISDVANWINTSDVCLAPRTPSFNSQYYGAQDSTKINEYAAFNKPIVANNYYKSQQYYLVNSDPISFSNGIILALENKIKPSKAHFWEEISVKLIKYVEETLF